MVCHFLSISDGFSPALVFISSPEPTRPKFRTLRASWSLQLVCKCAFLQEHIYIHLCWQLNIVLKRHVARWMCESRCASSLMYTCVWDCANAFVLTYCTKRHKHMDKRVEELTQGCMQKKNQRNWHSAWAMEHPWLIVDSIRFISVNHTQFTSNSWWIIHNMGGL